MKNERYKQELILLIQELMEKAMKHYNTDLDTIKRWVIMELKK